MKKSLLLCIVLITILSVVFMGCRSKSVALETATEPEVVNEPVQETVVQEAKEDISGKLFGKWRIAEVNGAAVLTDRICVSTYNCDGTAATSTMNVGWAPNVSWTYTLDGNILCQTNCSDGIVSSGAITEINDNGFVLQVSNVGKCEVLGNTPELKFVKVTADYKDAVLGMWESTTCQIGNQIKAESWRFDFAEDGSYQFYAKNSKGVFVKDAQLDKYVVDGDWLAKSWTADGKNYSEAWIIESCDETQMVLTAVCQDNEGSQYEKKFILNKVLGNLEK